MKTPSPTRRGIVRALRHWPVTLALLGGCASIGPDTVVSDRFDYSAAIAESWKRQTLLNIVKLRYMDLPVFVDVASIVAGYSLQTVGTVGGNISPNEHAGNSLSLGAGATFTDRPTITYVPLTGEKFLRGLLTPVDPKNIFFMLQAGYSADFILGLTVESLNGLRNRAVAAGTVREADPDFVRVLELLRDVQTADGLGIRTDVDKTSGATTVLFFRREGLTQEIQDKADEIRRLLHMPAGAQQFTLVYSPVRGKDTELAVNSRSMLQIMGAFSSYMDVPEEHLQDQSAIPAASSPNKDAPKAKVHIYSGKDKPDDAFASVQYRDYWFWIENSDWQSKRALTAIMFFFTLAQTGSAENLPVITIPAQ